ncbi:hypothetical protein HYC85_017330 [Camellia sinensis]|uniref:Uncharacterized protein n=1 Tax=Camellia sinensis TaxID=4442 RepID=A0A7J7H2B4_CAMSI|nr:hypothetical protein HYC85_017330 [Camellia sinensis]
MDCRWIEVATSPVMISTLENGKMVRGLEGIPSEGPVLFVGYHMLLALDTLPMCVKLWAERKIPLRPLAHPMMFERLRDGKLPDVSAFDKLRILGIVPVSATNLYKLLSSKSHVLLFLGGVREALHWKANENKTSMWIKINPGQGMELVEKMCNSHETARETPQTPRDGPM